MAELAPYSTAILALGLLGGLHLLQLVVADVVGIRRRHVPGSPVEGGHDDLLFRAVRAHANTNESLAAAALVGAFAILAGGMPALVNGVLLFFLGCRIAHMLSYYLDLRVLRSVAFGLGLTALFVLLVEGLRAY